MCNDAGEISRLSFRSQGLFELQKELAETEEKIHDLERRKLDARQRQERDRITGIEQWLEALRGKAVRLRSEISVFEASD